VLNCVECKEVDDKINYIEAMKSSNWTLVLSLINVHLFFIPSMAWSIGMFVKSETTRERSQFPHQKFFCLINNYTCKTIFYITPRMW